MDIRTLSTLGGRKEETNTSPCLRLAILGDICKINGLVTGWGTPSRARNWALV